MLQTDQRLRARGTNAAASSVTPPVSIHVDRDTPGVSIDLTTELRWFFDGPLPSDVQAWFMPSGLGLLEHRSDTYLLDEPLDVGVKERSRRLLELKLRTCPPEPVTLRDSAHGCLETWRRWSPADQLVSVDSDAAWLAVEKVIVKRRFGTDGREKLLSESTRALTGDGCDAEIAALSVDGRQAWTFALAAFGEPDSHFRSLELALRSVCRRQAPADRLRLQVEDSYGFPEWISRMSRVPPRVTNGHAPRPELL